MSVSPGGRSAPGSCHIRSQGSRVTQKQIICPIYRGPTLLQPLYKGGGTANFGKKAWFQGAQELRIGSLLQRGPESTLPDDRSGRSAAYLRVGPRRIRADSMTLSPQKPPIPPRARVSTSDSLPTS